MNNTAFRFASEVIFSAELLSSIDQWLRQAGSTCLLILKEGDPVLSWGDPAHRSEAFSVRKSLLSALFGTAVARGEIDLEATLADLGIDDKQGLSATERSATVRDLLQARSGIYHPSVYETQAMLEMKPPRHSHAPGEFFVYNNWDFNALGTIFEQATGLGVYDAFFERIAKPIGMRDYTPADGHYVQGAETVHRAYPFRMSSRDLAQFGQLYCQGGEWEGCQVIPRSWVDESTRPWSDARTGGYGYMWWTSESLSGDRQEITYPPGCYMARGNYGQYVIVFPAHQTVVVHRLDPSLSDKKVLPGDMPELLNLICPAMDLPPAPVGHATVSRMQD